VQKMRQFDELMKKQPGILFVSDIFKDPEKGTLTGFTFWESQVLHGDSRRFNSDNLLKPHILFRSFISFLK
jgi:hypothetical protein